ncbi:MAG TPA: phytanoyl-CoA dioxygenase family protein [Thermoanaerobaculia bacterium]
MAAPLSPGNLREAVDREGFAIVESVVRPADVEALARAIAEAGTEAWVRRRERDAFGIRNLLTAVPLVRRYASEGPMLEIASAVLGPGARPVKGLFFDKTSGANWKVPWHQDLTVCVRERRDVPGFGPWSRKLGLHHVQPPTEVLSGILALRLHLDDAGPEHGALKVIPGSHRQGRLDSLRIEHLCGSAPAVVCPVPVGGVMAMRPLLLHSSSPCLRPGHRRVVHIEYAAFELPGGLEWSG